MFYRRIASFRSLSRGLSNRRRREGNVYSFSKRGIEEVLEDLAITKGFGFDDDAWEGVSTEIIESQVEKAGNPGQETILEEYFAPAAISYCERIRDDYNPDGFVIEMGIELRDDMFQAISEIIDECAGELEDLHSQIFGNYGISFLFGATIGRSSRFYNSVKGTNGAKSYQNYLNDLTRNAFSSNYTPGRVFGSNQAALSSWQAGAIAKYGFGWNTYKASQQRSRDNAHKILTSLGYKYSPNNPSIGGYFTKKDLKKFQTTKTQVMISGRRW